MFRLEKVFQNDDSGFIYFTTFLKSILLFFIIYVSAILQKNTIYDLLSLDTFKNTGFYLEENDSIKASAGSSADLTCMISYERIV